MNKFLKHIIKPLQCMAFLLLAVTSSKAQVVINEYSASNLTLIADFAGDYEDYIELYNTSAVAVNLSGYFLSDNKNNIAKWQIPTGVTIAANGKRMVYCSGKDTVVLGSQIHTSFKLKQCHNEQIILSDASGNVVDSFTVKRTQSNHSRGRTTDGAATWSVFISPTPLAPNNTGHPEYVAKPTANVAAGFYNSTQNVTLSCTEPNSTIYYTLDGKSPTTSSTVYTTPIVIANTRVLRFFAVSNTNTKAPSFIETNTYLINTNHKFAVLSFCGNFIDTANFGGLFYTHGEIEQYGEMFDSLKNQQWETGGYARGHGNDSWAYDQKGFRVGAMDEYGYIAEYQGKHFANTPRDSFNVLIIKAGASDNYPGNYNGAHMRDAFCQTYSIRHNLVFDERSYQPCVVYINGNYWGLYEIRERVDSDFTEYYYDQPEKKVDLLRMWGGQWAEYGSDTGWTNLKNFIMANDMTLSSNLAIVDTYLDSIGFCDFHIYNNYVVNTDHMNYNTMWWRGTKGAGVPWHYAQWDQDNTFGLGQNFSGWPNTGGSVDPCAGMDLFNDTTGWNSIYHTIMLNKLMTNAQFKKRYRDRYVELVGRCLNCDSLLAYLDYFEGMLLQEMPQQCARWGGSVAGWQVNVQKIRQFILDRCALVGSASDSCFDIRDNIVNVVPAGAGKVALGSYVYPHYPFKGVMVLDSLYDMSAIANPGYVFSHWLKFKTANIISPSMSSANVFFDFKESDSIVAVFILQPKDSFNVTISNDAPYAGTVLVDGTTVVGLAPITFRWEENTAHTLVVSPVDPAAHVFVNYTKQANGNSITPSLTDTSVIYNMGKSNDNVVAHWDTTYFVQRYVYLPNAFTPNGDGVNDAFGNLLKFNPQIVEATMMVVDRFGNIVYNGDVKKDAWNGTYKGKPCNQDVYFYYIQLRIEEGDIIKYQGDVQLMR
jgi:gliding motility-associated-like protein